MRSSHLTLTLAACSLTAWAQAQPHPNPEAARAPVASVRPARATSAPSNTKVWVETPFEAPEFLLRDAQGVTVPTTGVTLRISENFGNLVVLTPTAALTPGSYSVARAGVELTTFTATAEVDTTPPAALVATATAQSFAPVFGQPRSRGGTSASIDFGAVPELVLVTGKDQQWLPGAALAMGVAESRSVSLFSLAEGMTTELGLYHFDLAGNATRSDVTVKVPLAPGCSVSGAWPLGVLVLALLRRRSRLVEV